MKNPAFHIRGYVKAAFTGSQMERFLNMCAHHKIVITNLQIDQAVHTMEIGLPDFYRMRPICRKTKTRVRILEKHGMPFFFYRNRKRKAFFAGIFLCILLLFSLSQHIWNIHIEGNYANSTQVILQYLKSQDITHGISKNKINCSQIAADLRKEFPEVVWVSARIDGTQLSITMKENEHPAAEQEEKVPCNLVADKNGTIVSMITRQGVPQMQTGQTCTKGDILVLGRLDITNDSGEVIRYEYVPSDADIYLLRNYIFSEEIPMNYQKRVYTGQETKHYLIQAFSWQLKMGWKGKDYEQYDSISQEIPLRLTENFVLPFRVGTITKMEYVQEEASYTEEEAKEKMTEKMQRFLEDLEEQGMKIEENNIRITVEGESCIGQGTVTVIEKTGETAPVERLEQPQIQGMDAELQTE